MSELVGFIGLTKRAREEFNMIVTALRELGITTLEEAKEYCSAREFSLLKIGMNIK